MTKTPSRRQFLLRSSTAMTFVHLPLLLERESLGMIAKPSVGNVANSPTERVWYSDSVSKLIGIFVEFKPTPYDLGANKSLGKVVLKRSSDQKEITVPFEKLSEVDRVYVASQLFAAKDLEQFEGCTGI